MSKKYYAQIIDNEVMHVIEGDPTGRFDPSIVWVACSPETKVGDVYLDNEKTFTDKVIDLSVEKKITLNTINLIYRNLSDKLTAGYDEREIQTWPMQIEEAYIVLSGKGGETPMLDQLSKKRYIDINVLASRVLGHNTVFRRMVGSIMGDRQYFEDIVNACTTYDALLQVRKQIQQWAETGSRLS